MPNSLKLFIEMILLIFACVGTTYGLHKKVFVADLRDMVMSRDEGTKLETEVSKKYPLESGKRLETDLSEVKQTLRDYVKENREDMRIVQQDIKKLLER